MIYVIVDFYGFSSLCNSIQIQIWRTNFVQWLVKLTVLFSGPGVVQLRIINNDRVGVGRVDEVVQRLHWLRWLCLVLEGHWVNLLNFLFPCVFLTMLTLMVALMVTMGLRRQLLVMMATVVVLLHGVVLSLREGNWIILRSISLILFLVRVVLMLIGPGRVVWDGVSAIPVGVLGVLSEGSHAWLAGLLHMLLCMMLVMLLLMVLLSMMMVVLFVLMVILLSK